MQSMDNFLQLYSNSSKVLSRENQSLVMFLVCIWLSYIFMEYVLVYLLFKLL